MLGPFTTTSRLTPIQQMSLAVLSRAACASMSTTTSTTTTTTTTTTRDRGDRYGPMEWAQLSLACTALDFWRTAHYELHACSMPICKQQRETSQRERNNATDELRKDLR